MIDNINKTEHRFDSMASIGKFGMRKSNSLVCQRSSQQGGGGGGGVRVSPGRWGQ